MYCSRCGAANPDGIGARYCRSCGAEIARPSAPSLGERLAFSTTARTSGERSIPNFLGEAPAAGTPLSSTSGAFPYAGFWVRLLAYVVDSIIIIFVAFLISRLTGTSIRTGDSGLQLILSTAYFVILPPALGATPGKLVLGLHIVDKDAYHIGFGRAFGRYIAQMLSAVALLLGFIWIGFDAQKQGWHDKIVGTYVVRKEFVKPELD